MTGSHHHQEPSVAQEANQGEFHPHVHHHENVAGGPKHHPGTQVGNDAVPESHVELHAAGTAPASRSFVPDPKPELRGFDDPTRDPLDQGGAGFTSLDADRGVGAPISGESSEEMHHDGKTHRKRERTGLTGLAKNYNTSTGREEIDESEKMK